MINLFDIFLTNRTVVEKLFRLIQISEVKVSCQIDLKIAMNQECLFIF